MDPTPDSAAATLARVLSQTAARVRLRRGILAITPGAITGGVIALLLLGAAKLSLIPSWLVWAAIAAVPLGAGTSFLFAWGKAIANDQMAEILDRRYGLAEKIVTGWEIAQRGAKTPMEQAAVAAAAEAAAKAEVRDAIPVRAPNGSGFSLASFVLPILLALFLPSWMPPFVRQANLEKEQLKQTGKELAKLAEQLSTPTPTPVPGAKPSDSPTAAKPEKEEPVEKLKKLAEKMQKGQISKHEAMKQLSDLDRELARKQSEEAKSQAGRSLARTASEMEKEESTKELGKAMSQGEAEQIRKEEKELEKKFDQKGTGTFEKKAQTNLADQLDKIADALEQGGDSQAAAEAREAAKALRKGDMQAAKDHLQRADLAGAVAAQHEGDPVHKMAKELKGNEATQAAGEKLDNGDGKKTADELEKLADKVEKGELGKEGEQQLSKTLEEAAKQGASQGENTPGGKLSKPMASAGKSLSKGNQAGAAEALRNMGQGMRAASATAKSNAEARDALAQARAQLNGEGSGGKVTKMHWGEGEGEQGEGKDGHGNGKSGASRTAATGSQDASTQAGYGTSKFEDKGYDATGSGPQHDRQSNRTDDWRKEYEQAYKAARTDKAKLSDSKIHGQMSEGESQSIQVDGKSDKGVAHEQYVSVPAEYREAAEEAVGNEDIPPEHRERVKAYFESLSGTADPKHPATTPDAKPAATPSP